MTTTKFLLVLLIGFFSFAAGAVKTHKNEKYKYLLNAPQAWIQQELKDKDAAIKSSFLSEDKKLSFLVLVAEENAKTSTKDFLTSMESARGAKNKLKVEEAKVGSELLKSTKAQEGTRGLYEFTGKGPNFPVVQKSLVLKRDKFIYTLMFTYPKAEEKKFSVEIDSLEKSFRILE